MSRREGFFLLAAFSAAFALQGPCWARMGIREAPGGDYETYLGHTCPPGDWCETSRKDMQSIASPTVNDIPFKHAFQWYVDQGWQINYGGDLSNNYKLTINEYSVHLCDPHNGSWTRLPDGHYEMNRERGHCKHGVQLEMSFAPDPNGSVKPGAGQDWYWIQRFTYGGWGCTPTGDWNTIDSSSSTSPYYGGSHPWSIGSFLDAPQAGCALYDVETKTWDNYCRSDSCVNPDPCKWWVQVYTYVAIGSTPASGNKELTIYDGVSWGFNAQCTPEPASIVALVCGLVALAAHRRRTA